jgi:hypothetical protein
VTRPDRNEPRRPVTAVVLDPGSRAIRSLLDPTAWMVLEELVLTGEPVADSRVETTTAVRALAAQLGLSKDTIAAALRRLAAAGIARRADEREPDSGRFGPTHYWVDLTTTGLTIERSTDLSSSDPDRVPSVSSAEATPPAQRGRRSSAPSTSGQLSLLEPE